MYYSKKNEEKVENYAKLIGEKILSSELAIDNWNIYNNLITKISEELKIESESFALFFRGILIPIFNEKFKVFNQEQEDGVIIGASSTKCG